MTPAREDDYLSMGPAERMLERLQTASEVLAASGLTPVEELSIANTVGASPDGATRAIFYAPTSKSQESGSNSPSRRRSPPRPVRKTSKL